MSKGSGRRRITPSDGLHYDEETMMTNIEERGGSHTMSAKKELRLGIRTGARPTVDSHYGSNGRRWAGKGRKNDNRNWKSHHRGKQYEKNARVEEARASYRPVTQNLVIRLRQKSINSDLCRGFPCKVWSKHGRSIPLKSIVSVSEKFLVKFGGESYRGYAARRAQPYTFSYSSNTYYRHPVHPTAEPVELKIGFAAFEQKVQRIQHHYQLQVNYS